MRTLTVDEVEEVSGGFLPLILGYKAVKVVVKVTLVSAMVSCEAKGAEAETSEGK